MIIINDEDNDNSNININNNNTNITTDSRKWGGSEVAVLRQSQYNLPV